MKVATVLKVATAVRRELSALGEDAARSPEAAQLLALARLLDDPGSAETARPAASREIRETLAVLRARVEAVPETDRLDELAGRRGTRRATG